MTRERINRLMGAEMRGAPAQPRWDPPAARSHRQCVAERDIVAVIGMRLGASGSGAGCRAERGAAPSGLARRAAGCRAGTRACGQPARARSRSAAAVGSPASSQRPIDSREKSWSTTIADAPMTPASPPSDEWAIRRSRVAKGRERR